MVQIVDGTSNTIMWGERTHNEPNWNILYPTAATDIRRPFVVYGRWSLFLNVRTSQEQINWKLPAMNPPPASGSPVWNDLYWKRLAVHGSNHPGGVNMAFCDGSVKFVKETLDSITFQALSTIAGSEVISTPY
jgi:prepilin-type processing-associated H-X9-DG protein